MEVATGAVTTLAGSGASGSADGVGGAAELYAPHGVTISPDGSALFVADNGNHKIRRVEVATGAVTTLAGSGEEGGADGVGDAAQFKYPVGLAISADSTTLLVRMEGSAPRQVCVASWLGLLCLAGYQRKIDMRGRKPYHSSGPSGAAGAPHIPCDGQCKGKTVTSPVLRGEDRLSLSGVANILMPK